MSDQRSFTSYGCVTSIPQVRKWTGGAVKPESLGFQQQGGVLQRFEELPVKSWTEAGSLSSRGWEWWELLEPQARQGSTVVSSVPARSALGWVPQQALVQQSALLPRMIRDVKVSPGIIEPVASGA